MKNNKTLIENDNRLPKPDSCKGCPFYDKGSYYVPDKLVSNSEVMFIAQNPGPDEEAGKLLLKRHWLGGSQHHDEIKQVTPQPLIGATGKLFNEQFLPFSGLQRDDISIGNAIRCRPGAFINGLKADELPTITTKMFLETSKSDIVKAIRHCTDAHLTIPDSVKTIVAMGSVALFQLTGHSDGMNWRGYVIHTTRGNIFDHRFKSTETYMDTTLPLIDGGINVFSTMHIAALYKGDNKRYYHATLRDFHRLGRFIRGQWPVKLPQWSVNPPSKWPSYSSFDTEYNPEDNNRLIRWSLCDTNNNLYCVESHNTNRINIPISPNSIVVIQNALADIAHLSNIIDVSTVRIEDLMLAHSTLYTGEPHNLNYINSMFGQYNRYKHLIHNEEQLYSSLDAYEPMHIWVKSIIAEFKKDPASYRVYKDYMLPLIPIIDKAQQTGVKLNGQRLKRVQEIYQTRLDEITKEVHLLTNDINFNIGGLKKLGSLLYKGEIGDLQKDTLIKLQQKFHFDSSEYKLINLRLEYSQKAKLLSNYINNLVNVERIYPRHLPTQKSFRWSTLEPPLTNFPRACIEPDCPDTEHEWGDKCWSVRDIVLPDDDEVLVTWDHDNIEGRIHDVYLNDQDNLKAHREGLDLHTITCCNMFSMDLPRDLQNPHTSDVDSGWRRQYNWQGKDTQRRVMAKNFNHGSKFAIDPKYVYTIPNIEKYGIDKKDLIIMAELHMASKKVIFDRKKKVMSQIKKSKIARNIQGAKRTFFDGSDHTAKEGFAFVISSTVSLYNNETLIMMAKRWPSFRLIHNAHDGDKVCFKKDEVPSIDELKEVIERPIKWEGREVMLTAGIKIYENR